MIIPIGNHMLLRDHLEGCNKIQDRYKTDVYVVVGHHQEKPNVYYIQLLNIVNLANLKWLTDVSYSTSRDLCLLQLHL